MSVTRIEVKDLVVRYGDQVAVNGVSFTVGRGELVEEQCFGLGERLLHDDRGRGEVGPLLGSGALVGLAIKRPSAPSATNLL